MASTQISGKGKRALQAADTRQRILDAALDLFGHEYPAQVTTRQVAAAAGVAEGLVFHYFPTRSNLLGAALEGRASLMGGMLRRLDAAQGRPAEAALPELARLWLQDLFQQEALSALVFTLQGDASQRQARQAAFQGLCSRLAAYLTERAQAGELRPGLPAGTAAQVFLSSLLAFFLDNRHLTEAGWRANAALFADGLASLLLGGMLRRPAVFTGRGKWNV